MHKPLSKKTIKQLNKRAAEEINQVYRLKFLLQDVQNPINVGSFFRIADALGVEEIVLTQKTPRPPDPAISATARGLERRISNRHFPQTEEAIAHIKEEDYTCVAVELTEDSKHYTSIDYAEKICLVLGNEASGIYKKNLGLCDYAVHIPMLGKGPSLNVHVAGAIVASHIVSKFKHS